MDWYDETLTDIGINPDTATGPTSDMSNDDILEAIGMALGDGATQAWVPQSFSNDAFARAADRATDRTDGAPRAESGKETSKEASEGGILGRISNFVDKNKSLSEILLKGVAGAAAGNQAKKASEIAAQSRLDELKLKNQQDREKDAQVSASVSGLRAPTGLIGRPQKQLLRADGTPVYQNGRIA